MQVVGPGRQFRLPQPAGQCRGQITAHRQSLGHRQPAAVRPAGLGEPAPGEFCVALGECRPGRLPAVADVPGQNPGRGEQQEDDASRPEGVRAAAPPLPPPLHERPVADPAERPVGEVPA